MPSTKNIGSAIENLACAYLIRQGFRIYARNYRYKTGEIDIIGLDEGCLTFVEVRYRSSENYGGAIASIDLRKQQRIIRTAHYYLIQHPLDLPCRFDAVLVNKAQEVTWLKHAFEA